MENGQKASAKKDDTGYAYDSAFPSRLRKLLGITKTRQESLAEHCGVSRQSVAQWKDGKTKPDIYYLGKIADFFNVTTDFMLGRSTIPNSSAVDVEIEKMLGLPFWALENLKQLAQDRETSLIASAIIGNSLFISIINDIKRYIYIKKDNAVSREYLAQLHKKAVKELDGMDYGGVGTPIKKLMTEILDALNFYRENRNNLFYGDEYQFIQNIQRNFELIYQNIVIEEAEEKQAERIARIADEFEQLEDEYEEDGSLSLGSFFLRPGDERPQRTEKRPRPQRAEKEDKANGKRKKD
jgi:transcriptional regulator with XRE-family HTH domain